MKYVKGLIAILLITVFGYLAGTLSSRDTPKTPIIISHGEADIGGAFEMVDTQGQSFRDTDLLGKFSLIYFGYTHCPDVCPLDMNRISMALDLLEQDINLEENLVPVFITVDPLRDPPEVAADFLSGYHHSIVGLTGTQEQMEVAAKAYKVYWEEMLNREHSQMTMDEPILISHSAYIYLMDREGKYISHFDETFPASKLATEIKKYMDKF